MRKRCRRDFWFLLAALAALVGVGGTKLAVALAAGRSNVGFLIVMMLVAVVIAFKLRGPYRTASGDILSREHAQHVRAACRSALPAIRPGTGSRELLWLTALFGATAVPAAAFPFVAASFGPSRRRPELRLGCGSSCGSGSSGVAAAGAAGCGGCGS